MSITGESNGVDIDGNKENQDGSERRITISALVSKRPDNTNEFFVEVYIVWSSECTEKSSQDPTRRRFILADDTGHIQATLPLGDRPSVNANNICCLLKAGKTVRIRNFHLETLAPQFWPLLRKQNVQILFSYSSKDTVEIPWNPKFYRHLPFVFTEINQALDHNNHEFVDIIGFSVKVLKGEVSKDKNITYDKVVLSSCRSRKLGTGNQREIALFKDHIGTVSINQVYAMLNVRVTDFKNNKSLDTNSNTVILRLTESNHFMIPPNYFSMSFVKDVITSKGNKRRLSAVATPTKRRKPLLGNQTDQKDINQEDGMSSISLKQNIKSYYKLSFGVENNVKHDVIPKISSDFVSVMKTPAANHKIILELYSLGFLDNVDTVNLRSSQNITEQQRMSELMDLIESLEPEQIKACLEKLCNLSNQPRKSQRLRSILQCHFPGSVIREDELARIE